MRNIVYGLVALLSTALGIMIAVTLLGGDAGDSPEPASTISSALPSPTASQERQSNGTNLPLPVRADDAPQWTGAEAPSDPIPVAQHPDYAYWDVQIHSRDQTAWDESGLGSHKADHGADCSGAPTPAEFPQHESHTYGLAVFVCNNHVMSTMQESGYGMIALTPNYLMDWSEGSATVQWRMSTFRSSDRDWLEFWVTPWESNLTLPLQNGFSTVDLQGPPPGPALGLFENGDGETQPGWVLYSPGSERTSGGSCEVESGRCWASWYKIPGFVPDKARRDLFQLTITSDRVTLSMPEYGYVLADAVFGAPLPFTSGVFQLTHHSYNPTKGKCVDNCDVSGAVGGTWHFDEVMFSGGYQHFHVIHSKVRSITGIGDSGPVEFERAAPANSWLRFSAAGRVEVDFGGGFVTAEPQKTENADKVRSYFVPIPEGTQSVEFRLSPAVDWAPAVMIRDLAIWAQAG